MRHPREGETHIAFVAYRDSRQRKDGTVTHFVRWVDPATKKQRTQKVASEDDANFLVTVLNAHGNDVDAALNSAKDHYKGIYTVTRMIEDHIALLTNAKGYTIRRYKSNHKCRVADTLGTLDATKVEYRDIVQWMKGMEAKGLASKTIAITTASYPRSSTRWSETSVDLTTRARKLRRPKVKTLRKRRPSSPKRSGDW